MQRRQVLSFAPEGEDAAHTGRRRLGAQHRPTLGLQRGNQPGTLALQFGRNPLNADFQNQFQRRVESGQTEQVVSACFIAAGVRAQNHLLLR